jgi:hypothetical protein
MVFARKVGISHAEAEHDMVGCIWRSLMPMISAAWHQVIFFAIARKITSCVFTARSTAAFE